MEKITVINHPTNGGKYARRGEYIGEEVESELLFVDNPPNVNDNPFINCFNEWNKWLNIGIQGYRHMQKMMVDFTDYGNDEEFVQVFIMNDGYSDSIGLKE